MQLKQATAASKYRRDQPHKQQAYVQRGSTSFEQQPQITAGISSSSTREQQAAAETAAAPGNSKDPGIE
jgi:hypothetical protein